MTTDIVHKAAYAKRRTFLMKSGRWVHPISGDEVRAHITRVRAANGMTLRQYAEAAKIDEKWFNEIARGTRCKVVTAGMARRIMSVTAATPLPPSGLVDSTGTVRRLRALAVAGWSAPMVAPMIGLSTDHVIRIRRGRTEVYATTAANVTAVYRALWLKVPPYPEGHVNRIKRDAVRRGWKAGACFDDIDDPNCKPVGMRKDVAS